MSIFTRKKRAKKKASPSHCLLGEELEPRLLFSAGFEAVFLEPVDAPIEKLGSNSAPIWLDADTGNIISSSSNGDDIFLGSNGDDLNIDAGGGKDLLYGAEGNDKLNGGQWEDILHGGPGDDELRGGNDKDILIGGGGSDKMWGDKGQDIFLFTGAQDGDEYEVDGGNDTDTIDLSEFGSSSVMDDGSTIRVDLGYQSFTITYSSIEEIITAETSGVNHTPQANAGPDQVVTVNTPVTLNGLGSDLDVTDVLTFEWTQISGPWITLNDQISSSPIFVAPNDPTILTFILTVSDGTVQNIDMVEITVSAANTNSPPTAIHLSNQAIDENTDTTGGISIGVLTTDDPDTGDTFSYTIISGEDHLSIGGTNNDELILDDGVLDYETKSSYHVIVQSRDAGSLTRNEQFFISVTNDNPPVGQEDFLILDEGATATLLESGQMSVLANDTDAEQSPDTLTVSLDTGPSHSFAFVLNTDGTFSYTHDGTENLTDSFTYTVTDNDGQSSQATVAIIIHPIEDEDEDEDDPNTAPPEVDLDDDEENDTEDDPAPLPPEDNNQDEDEDDPDTTPPPEDNIEDEDDLDPTPPEDEDDNEDEDEDEDEVENDPDPTTPEDEENLDPPPAEDEEDTEDEDNPTLPVDNPDPTPTENNDEDEEDLDPITPENDPENEIEDNENDPAPPIDNPDPTPPENEDNDEVEDEDEVNPDPITREDQNDPESNPEVDPIPITTDEDPIITSSEVDKNINTVIPERLSGYRGSSDAYAANSPSLVNNHVSRKPFFNDDDVNLITQLLNDDFVPQHRRLEMPDHNSVDSETPSYVEPDSDLHTINSGTRKPAINTASHRVAQSTSSEFMTVPITPASASQANGETAQKPPTSADAKMLIRRPEFIRGLNDLREDTAAQVILDKTWLGSSVAVSTGLWVGYVIWLVRGGVLLSTLLSTLPAWRIIDPLLILMYANKRSLQQADDADEDSLASLVNKNEDQTKPEQSVLSNNQPDDKA
jgi:hypothetical protein